MCQKRVKGCGGVVVGVGLGEVLLVCTSSFRGYCLLASVLLVLFHTLRSPSKKIMPSVNINFFIWERFESIHHVTSFDLLIISFSSAPLLEDSIVRTRGFSPRTTDVKLARFFSGLNIER